MNPLQKKVITLLDAITKDIVLNAQIETELTEASLASLNNLRLLSSVPSQILILQEIRTALSADKADLELILNTATDASDWVDLKSYIEKILANANRPTLRSVHRILCAAFRHCYNLDITPVPAS